MYWQLCLGFAERKSKLKNAKDFLLPIRQLVSWLTSEHLEEFLDLNIRKQKYGKLTTDLEKILKILEKYVMLSTPWKHDAWLAGTK
jgi:hypothetical protein